MTIRLPFITEAVAAEFAVHKFSCDASDLGLRPGDWPERLPTNLGNQMPFVRSTKRLAADRTLVWVTYQQANGCISLRVYND